MSARDARALALARQLVAVLEDVSAEPTSPPPAPAPAPEPLSRRRLAWGARVSATFRDRAFWLAEDLGMPPDDLMSCMAFETGRTFRADVRNMAGSGATGLIQFMPATALGFFHTTKQIEAMSEAERRTKGRAYCDRLAAMTAEDQLNYVWKYFAPYKGRLRNLGDVYMAILWPGAVGQADSFVLFDRGKRPTAYRQNAGLDVNRDGKVTRGEALAKVAALKTEGLRPGNVWEG